MHRGGGDGVCGFFALGDFNKITHSPETAQLKFPTKSSAGVLRPTTGGVGRGMHLDKQTRRPVFKTRGRSLN